LEVKALVVDDHPLIQEAVRNVLLRLEPGVDVVLADNCEQGLEIAGDGVALDLVLLDLELPGMSGIAALKHWRKRFPDVPVVILSATTDRPTVLAAMTAGAAGFIPKSSSNDVMTSAVRLVLAGGKYLPPQVLAAARQEVTAPPARDAVGSSVSALGLTGRQIEVLRLIAKGASNKLICRELGLAERTVKSHVTAILRAMHVSTRTQAALIASKLEWDDQAADHEIAREVRR